MILDALLKEHSKLVQEIYERDIKISELRDTARIVREAIDRYCPPNLRDSAEMWLRDRGF